MKLNGVSIILAVSALTATTVVNGKRKGRMTYGISPMEMIFGGLGGEDVNPMEIENQARLIRGIPRIFSPQSPEFLQSQQQLMQMSPNNNNVFLMSNNDQPNQADNEIEADNLMMNNFQQQRKDDAAEIQPKSTFRPGVFSDSFDFSPKFEIPRLPEGLLDQNPFNMNPMMMNLESPMQQRSNGDEAKPEQKQQERKLNIELDFQVEMPKPNEDKTSKSPMEKDEDIVPVPVTTAKPNAASEQPKDGKAVLSLLDFLLPTKKERKPAEQAVSSRCDTVSCVPPPKESTCHLEKAAIEIKGTDGGDSKFEELSDCCPLWLCTRPDGSFHTHYAMIGKLPKKEVQEPPKPVQQTSARNEARISFQSSESGSNSKTFSSSPRIIAIQPLMGSASSSSSSSPFMPFESILRNLFSSPLFPPKPPSRPAQKSTDDVFPQNFMSNSRPAQKSTDDISLQNFMSNSRPFFPSPQSSMSVQGESDNGNLQGWSMAGPGVFIRTVSRTSSNLNRQGDNEDESFQFPQGFLQQQQQQQQQPFFLNRMPMMQQEQQQAQRQQNFPGLPIIPPMIF